MSKNEKELFKAITPDIKSKLIQFVETGDSNNWLLAFTLLRSIKGVGRYTAERWLFKELQKIYSINTFDLSLLKRINDFCDVYFKQANKKGIVYGLPYGYSNVFSLKDAYKDKSLIGMTQARSIGKTYMTKQLYKWKI